MTAAQLKIARDSLHLTQAALADAIGYKDPMSVSRWERGVEPIPVVVALAVTHLACRTIRVKRRD